MGKYRIVKDNYSGFEVQKKNWWWPFWFQLNNSHHPVNTFSSIETAKNLIKLDKEGFNKRSGVVWQEGVDE